MAQGKRAVQTTVGERNAGALGLVMWSKQQHARSRCLRTSHPLSLPAFQKRLYQSPGSSSSFKSLCQTGSELDVFNPIPRHNTGRRNDQKVVSATWLPQKQPPLRCSLLTHCSATFRATAHQFPVSKYDARSSTQGPSSAKSASSSPSR